MYGIASGYLKLFITYKDGKLLDKPETKLFMYLENGEAYNLSPECSIFETTEEEHKEVIKSYEVKKNGSV